MIRLLTIIGARPQIIKAAALSRTVKKWNARIVQSGDTSGSKGMQAEHVQEVILHTGQHYDDNMSAVFFRELGIPEPDINLHVGSGSHGVQTARMIEGIEAVLKGELLPEGNKDGFDGVVLYGDTNSTLAGAVAASKLNVPVFHIEAGLRSWNRTMPEEINRIVCDQLSNILFTPTQTGYNNLLREGIAPQGQPSKPHFVHGKGQYMVLSGDVMYDNALHFAKIAEQKCDILSRLGLHGQDFVLATIHRPANTDNAAYLTAIFSALAQIVEEGMTIVLPLHPRTRKMLPEKLPTAMLRKIASLGTFKVIEPASFYEILTLEKHAKVVMTDSGGVQKEAFFYETPTVILRPETEWVEIVDAGAGILADADADRIMTAYRSLANQKVHFPALFGDGHAAEKILSEIMAY